MAKAASAESIREYGQTLDRWANDTRKKMEKAAKVDAKQQQEAAKSAAVIRAYAKEFRSAGANAPAQRTPDGRGPGSSRCGTR